MAANMNASMGNEKVKLTAVINGVQTQIPAATVTTLLGKSWTPAQLVQAFTAALTAMQTVAATKVQLADQIQGQTAALQAGRQLYQALEKYCQGMYGKGAPQLGAFGFSTQPPQPKSAETKALAAAKSKLTRVARGTKGKRQKLAVTTSGSPGLVLVGANGQAIPGVTQGPIAPVPPVSSNSSVK